jgi:metallo-beta-lactamase class B
MNAPSTGAALLVCLSIFLSVVPAARAQQQSIFGRSPDGGPLIDLGGRPPDGGPGPVSGSGSLPIDPARLDKEIIRRIIRGHINDVKGCYEALLTRDPWVAGRILMGFTVSATGTVVAAAMQESTMLADSNQAVAACIQHAMLGWAFPKPLGGGKVIIAYPFVLTPGSFKQIASGPGAKENVSVGALDGTFFPFRVTNAEGIPANGLVVKTNAGLLLIDAIWTDAQTEAVLKWGEARFKQPWIGAVITHDHADRSGGLAALSRRHVPIGALDLTVDRLRGRGIEDVSVLLAAAAGSRIDPRGFELFYPGPGHTRDNIVIWFATSKVLYGGCLIKEKTSGDLGFTADADLAAWPAAVRRVADRYPAPSVVIPGYGDPLLHDPYAHTLELLAHAHH